VSRAVTYAVLVAAMIAFGFGVYHAASALKSNHKQVVRPSAEGGPSVPGTMYLAQDGALYRLKDRHFTQITDEAGWLEPAASPDGSELVAVRQTGNYSDLYLLTSTGRVVKQLTHHSSPQVESNHWSFFPRFSADGTRVFYSYDAKVVGSYEVDLAIFSIAIGSGAVEQWTTPNAYTGGDVDPVPLKGGALLYTKYSIDNQSQVHSQIWFQPNAAAAGVALTQAADNCSSPAVSLDGRSVAMVCRRDQLQTADVVIVGVNADGTWSSPVALVQGKLAASPAFSPNGRMLAFLAPVETGGAFQLWSVPVGPLTSGAEAKSLTSNVGLDATSAPVWIR
jgi:Tol biopolymer transport system component